MPLCLGGIYTSTVANWTHSPGKKVWSSTLLSESTRTKKLWFSVQNSINIYTMASKCVPPLFARVQWFVLIQWNDTDCGNQCPKREIGPLRIVLWKQTLSRISWAHQHRSTKTLFGCLSCFCGILRSWAHGRSHGFTKPGGQWKHGFSKSSECEWREHHRSRKSKSWRHGTNWWRQHGPNWSWPWPHEPNRPGPKWPWSWKHEPNRPGPKWS